LYVAVLKYDIISGESKENVFGLTTLFEIADSYIRDYSRGYTNCEGKSVKTDDDIEYCEKHSEINRLAGLTDIFKKYIIIDGLLYKETGEPRYHISTFGLGHNHGGTGMFIDNCYNSNINRKNYFTALQREECIAYGKQVATRRGDTESVEGLGDWYDIKVLIPEAVKCNPQIEAGEGCEFINKVENIINNCQSVGEAGLFVMLTTLNGLNGSQEKA
jgi:hypothetical protein